MSYETRTEFDAAVTAAADAAALYYDAASAGTPEVEMLDTDYDSLVGHIEIALTEHPEWASNASTAVLNAVAAGASTGGDVTHPHPMLSLSKAPTAASVAAFIADLGGRVVIEPKLDGLAIRAVYTSGALTQVVLRGDGQTGEDITSRVLVNGTSRVAGLPVNVPTNEPFEVRGEVYLSDTDFATANVNRTAAGKESFANPRNAAAGALRKENATYIVPMSFAAYDVSGFDEANECYSHRIALLTSRLGILSAYSLIARNVPTDPTEAVTWIGENRATLGYPIDGCVIKADTNRDRARLGSASRAPKWAIAFKYAAEEATTRILDIEMAIGRTGRLSLRARVEPVSVGGTIIEFSSLHNVGFVQRQDIRINDIVHIKRANDVIPYVSDPDLSLRPLDSTPWVAPDGCPKCGEPFDKSTELWRCLGTECSMLSKVVFACGRDQLDLMGMSTSIVTALVESGRVSDVADLFTLTKAELAELVLGETPTGSERRLGNANAAKIITEIEKAKSQPLNRVIGALGIRKTGRTMSRRLSLAFPTMAAFQAATVPQLCNVEGIAEGKAETIHDDLAKMSDMIARLAAAGVNMGESVQESPEGVTTVGGAALAGMSIVVTGKVTGSLAGLSRNEMNELIEAHGGKSSGSVSAKTSMLVCSEPGSSKHTKAVDLGVRIVTPEEFADLVG